jgi:PAS domain S-box-containing protein
MEAPLHLADGATRHVLVRPRLAVLQDRPWLAVTLQDITRRRRAELAQAQAEGEARRRLAELETLYRTAPLGLAQFDDELRFVRVNEALADMNGIGAQEHLGRSAWQVVPDLQEKIEPLLRQVLATGERITGVSLSGQTPALPGVTRDWVAQYYPVRDPETRQVASVGIMVEETTGLQRAERAHTLLLRELDHRVKNLFAVIAGLVAFSARGAATPQEMRATLLGRIDALARAHDLVKLAIGGGFTEAPAAGQHTTLQALAEALLGPFRMPTDPERLRLHGEPVPVGALAAPPLALVLHELATNAARHGALSGPVGSLAVQWQPAGRDGTLRLTWDEQAEAMPAQPSQGFGQRLVAQCAAQLGGRASFDWRERGLLVELALPLARLQG